MFVDYISLMLVNMVAGLFILAHFVYAGVNQEDRTRWVPGFAAVGLVAVVTGFHMALTWPIPRMETANLTFANVAFGETTVLLGVLFLSAALACAMKWRLDAIAIYAFFAGLAAVVVGVQIWCLGLTASPRLAGTGFVLTGLSGVLFCPIACCLRDRKEARVALTLLLVVAGLLWALVAYKAYWGHLASFSQLK